VDLISIIILLGIIQGFFIGLLLIMMKSPNLRANRFLGVLYFSFSISISHFFLLRTGLYYDLPHLIRVAFPSLFLFGPLFYFYVRILTDRSTRLRAIHLLHLLPFLITVLLSLPFYLSSVEAKLDYLENISDMEGVHLGMIMGGVQLFHIFAYVVAIRKILRRYDQRIKQTKSSIERINLRWLWLCTAFFIGVFGLIFVLIVLQALGVPTLEFYGIAIPIAVSFIIYFMGYLGLRQPEIFSASEETGSGKKYARSTLSPERAAQQLEKLQAFMTDNKPYLESELTLTRLAEQLDVPPHHLSQMLNESLSQNFFDFVNSYRVEEAKQLLQVPDKSAYTVLALAEEAGFNSKTAFNTAFKRFTGETPTEYRKSRQQSLQAAS
jgi:AraC-like DNA-binding protein